MKVRWLTWWARWAIAVCLYPAVVVRADTVPWIDELIREGDRFSSEPLTDEAFLEKAGRKILGRAPSGEEKEAFRVAKGGDRAAWVEHLLTTDEAATHLAEVLAPLLRTREDPVPATTFVECETEEGRREQESSRMAWMPRPPVDAYRDWVEAQFRKDRPWDELVVEILAASGTHSDNPAVGYLLRQRGGREGIASEVFAAFLGTEITCARCHHHPHEEVYQLDHLRIAACFGELQFQPVEKRSLLEDGALIDAGPNRVRVPEDYRYDDFEPGALVPPGVYFGSSIDPADGQTLRQVFADWVTEEQNPRFTVNIVNRLWGHVFDEPLLAPPGRLPGDLGKHPEVPELLRRLTGELKAREYRLREFLVLLYGSKAFTGGD